MKPDTSARRNSRSNAFCEDVMARTAIRLVICLENSGYEASLERRKIYIALPEARAEQSFWQPEPPKVYGYGSLLAKL
jgi:hypothetical protein